MYVGFVFIFNIYIGLMMNYILTVLIDISICVYNYLLCKLNYDYLLFDIITTCSIWISR